MAAYKSMAVVTQAEAEMVEEGRINCLMRKLSHVVKEKGRVVLELEREEEMLTNTLQKKLNQVRREKAELEKQIEREHEDNLVLRAQLQNQKQLQEQDGEETKGQQKGEEEGNDEIERTERDTSQNGNSNQIMGSTTIVNHLTSRFQSTLEPFHDE